MEKVHRPKGLIRYASEDSIVTGNKPRFTPRMKLYTGVLVILLAVSITLLALRSAVEATVLRTTGSMYEELADGTIRNVYTVKVTNKTGDDLPLELRLLSSQGTLKLLGPPLEVPPQGQDESVFSIQIPKVDLLSPNSLVEIGLFTGDRELTRVKTSFAGPMPGMGK